MNNNIDNNFKELVMEENTSSILDSKHIVTTNISMYDIKVIDCNSYVQVYIYQDKKSRILKKEKSLDLELKKMEFEKKFELINKNTNEKKELSNNVEERSIIRSKLECQRLAKSNIEDWQTFITLTFDPKTNDFDLSNIELANKQFRYFIDKVKRVKKDFKYLCVPEFHKSGAVHYHILTNISIKDNKLIYRQEDNKKFLHIKYWNNGFDSVEIIKGDPKKIVGYISKYMTKDIDNRLFNRHRYFYSRNLNLPKPSYIDLSNERDKDFYKKIIQDKSIIYQDTYINPYDSNKVVFLEYLK